jgi:hypothetical protein
MCSKSDITLKIAPPVCVQLLSNKGLAKDARRVLIGLFFAQLKTVVELKHRSLMHEVD